MLVCDKCNAGIIEGAKFCPQCGDPVTSADRVTVPAGKSEPATVEISFGRSSSAGFSRAVEICKNIPSYTTSGEGKEELHRVLLPITEVELVINLFDLVGSWKSSQMLINGHAATKKDLTYHGVGCYRSRQKAYKPQQYCFGERQYEMNIWGCKRLNMPINEWGGGWLDYGRFDSSGVWHFDKARIRHELEIALKENQLCPVLDRDQVLKTLESLPESINPKSNKDWEYRTSYEEVNGTYKEVAVGVKPVLKKINRFVVGEYKPHWEADETPANESVNIRVSVGETQKPDRLRHIPENKKGGGNLVWIVAIAVIILMAFMF